MKCDKCGGLIVPNDGDWRCFGCSKRFSQQDIWKLEDRQSTPKTDVEEPSLIRSSGQALAMQRPFETRRCERLKGSGRCRRTAVRKLSTGQHTRWFCEPCAQDVEALLAEGQATGKIPTRLKRERPLDPEEEPMKASDLCQQCKKAPPSPGHGRCEGCLKKMREAYHARKAKAGKRTAPSRAVERERERERERRGSRSTAAPRTTAQVAAGSGPL